MRHRTVKASGGRAGDIARSRRAGRQKKIAALRVEYDRLQALRAEQGLEPLEEWTDWTKNQDWQRSRAKKARKAANVLPGEVEIKVTEAWELELERYKRTGLRANEVDLSGRDGSYRG